MPKTSQNETSIFGKIFNAIFQNLNKIQWAPLNVPLHRRLQTLGAAAWITFLVFGELIAVILFVKLVYSEYWFLAILYSIWMLNDVGTCDRGGRKIEWVRNWRWWWWFRDYFPLKLVKTVDLDPNRNYLFACYPHGVVSTGAFGAFATNALDFYKIFPGMDCNMITLQGHFMVPLFREWILAHGACSSSEQSLLYLLDQKRHKGKCVALIVGGAAEALDAHPGEYKILLSKRKGFIRTAIKSGAPIVPVFSFGEPDVFRPFDNPQNSLLRRFQEAVKRYTGISPILPLGRGIFQYSLGFVPLRAPITNVVGAPLEVVRNLEPTNEEVEAVHKQFTERLVELFEKEKSKYLKNPEETKLTII